MDNIYPMSEIELKITGVAKDVSSEAVNTDLSGEDKNYPHDSFRKRVTSFLSTPYSVAKSCWGTREYIIGGVVLGTSAALYSFAGLESYSLFLQGFRNQPPLDSVAVKAVTEAAFLNGFSFGVLISDWLKDPVKNAIYLHNKTVPKRFER